MKSVFFYVPLHAYRNSTGRKTINIFEDPEYSVTPSTLSDNEKQKMIEPEGKMAPSEI